MARVDLGYQNGRRKRKDYYGRTRREVLEKLASAQRALKDGLPVTSDRQKLGQFLERWLEDVARPSVRPRTYIRYRELLALHVLPTLSNRPLARLAPQDLHTLYRRKLQDGLSPGTVRKIHSALHRPLRDAVRWGLVGRNVCDAVTPPKLQTHEIKTLSPDKARQLLVATEGDPLEALYVLAITAGLRQGELLGLKWQDVDLDAGRLEVRRTIARVNGQGFLESEPKSARSRRGISLAPMATEALRDHRARQLQRRLLALAWEDNDFIFPNEVGRPIEAQNLVRRSFYPLLERAGLPRMRFHDLRHTAATLLLVQGVHPKIVQEILGHSTISLTLDTYSHVIPGLQEEAAKKMEALLASR